MDEKKPEPKKEPVEPKSSSTEAAATSSSSAAAAPPKRSFMPNIGVQRAKKEVKEEETKGSQRKPPQPNLNRAGRGARGGGRGGAHRAENLIQSHSIFEAGPGQSVKRYGGDKEYYESTTRISSGGGVGVGSSSSFKREANSAGPDQPQRSLRIEENLLIEDVKDEDEDSAPYVCIKYEKEEPPLLTSATTTSEKVESNLDPSSSSYSVLRQIFDPLDLNEERDKLLLFQIPETLGLGELDEGQIGKLRIRKSGKIELCINDDIVLGVSLSVAGSFLQDATVLELNDEQNSGKLTSLGHIENKIVTYQKL